MWLSRGENAHLPACFACLSSQDQGKTWRCSSVVPAGNGVGDPTESSVAERSDGTLLATMRHEIPGVRRRAFCESKKEIDGEDTIRWGEPWLNQELPDPICGGALLSLSDGKMALLIVPMEMNRRWNGRNRESLFAGVLTLVRSSRFGLVKMMVLHGTMDL